MSNSCGEIRFMEGGTLKDSTILNSSITNSVVSNSTVESSTITNSTVDDATANSIIQAISHLRVRERRVLTDALLEALLSTTAKVGTIDCHAGNVPAFILGGDDYALGKPAGWLRIGNGALPVYEYDECQEGGLS